MINEWQYYHKKDTSKVYVIWSSPRELISVQIINLDFRLQKIQLRLIMTQEKRKRLRHYLGTSCIKYVYLSLSLKNYMKFEKQIFCPLLLNYCLSEGDLHFYLS